jgi:hypothetical protein
MVLLIGWRFDSSGCLGFGAELHPETMRAKKSAVAMFFTMKIPVGFAESKPTHFKSNLQF